MHKKNSYKMTISKFKRIFAFFMAINIFFEVVSPTVAMALTSGPGQPEMASFEPVGTTDMVDVFSGDFNYNIPLLTVPGPNGGYPINMAYHAGIGMNDEASWVGLGWNINPGVISRNMRGLPDDFNGESVNKQLNMRPNKTLGLGFGVKFPELWGLKAGIGFNSGITWNNYKGFGLSSGISISAKLNSNASAGIDMSYNSLSGETSLTPNISFTDHTKKADNTFKLSASISSLSGLKDLNFSTHRNSKYSANRDGEQVANNDKNAVGSALTKSPVGASTSFASSAFTPNAEFPSTGFNISTNFSLGVDILGDYINFDMNASYSQTKYEKQNIDFSAYGYLNSENRGALSSKKNDDVYKIMDFNREKDAALSKDIPAMPVPIATYDTYMVKGQGIGGVFRPYRTDIPFFADPAIFSENTGGSLGVELGLGFPTMNFGGNLSLNYAQTYSGPWHNSQYWEDISQTASTGNAYFKQAGEMVADEDEETDFYMNHSYPITVVGDWENIASSLIGDLSFEPFVEIRADLDGVTGPKKREATRKTCAQLMSYKTFDEVGGIPNYFQNFVQKSVYTLNANPLLTPNTSFVQATGSQIAEMSVINPDGNRYIYALPAKNNKQKEVSFAVNGNLPSDKIVNYSTAPGQEDNSVNNQKGEDYYFSSTEIPSYVHSYMLTAIVSPDYIDLKDDGLTEDDFGYWVKFNYTKTADTYKWRMPFGGANHLPGYLSASFDDKAGYTYGEKELWFLNSIETKSHIANFTLSDRSDAKGAAAENNIYFPSPDPSNMDPSAGGQQKLDKIALYSKAFPQTPLKEVNFTYNYELCKQTLNSNALGTNGKLTLKKVTFSYMGSAKGELSPYIFDYHANIPDENPDYGIFKEDCWGNYKENTFGTVNTNFPYSSQLEDYDGNGITDNVRRNNNASAWNLKEITLPSGGKIKVDYEADDYAYVHDKKAMELVRIVGFGPDPNNIATITQEMTHKNNLLFFEIPNPSETTTDDHVKKFIHGIDPDVYFKVFMKLKSVLIGGVDKDEYVSGYATIDTTICGLASSSFPESGGPYSGARSNIKIGYVKFNPVDVSDVIPGAKTHPFRKAGWQYLKLQRRDVLYPSSDALSTSNTGGLAYVAQIANACIGAFTSSIQLFTGYYSYCSLAGYCGDMVKQSSDFVNHPSFIRLNTPNGKKYGGGHRVKKIVITDTWTQTGTTGEAESQYGQEYSYRLADGSTSSGVAAYEPLIGGEEIPHHKPIRYSSSYFILKNENLYMEEPIGESYYPAASVGYSRVIVKNIKQIEDPSNLNSNEITKSREGITVHEFYTTKDFPYQMNRSFLNHEKFTPKIPIPLIGSVGFENHGFSQYMDVTTNDMHGRAKSVATYAAGTDINNSGSIPVSKIEYIYNSGNRVNALFGDAYYKDAAMGITEEKYVDSRQTWGVAVTGGLQVNVDWTAPYLVVPTFMPIIDYSENMYKSIVNIKVTSKTGILMETRSYNEGSSVSTKNLLFDAYTGKPLLTTVTNDFDKPIYKYEYAAQWAYDAMGGAYKNDRAPVSVIAGGGFSTNSNVFPGDELYLNLTTGATKAWVSDNYTAILDNGSVVGGTGAGIVIRSGRRNQQSISNGSIVSLTNPVSDRKYNLFTDYNQLTQPVTNYQSFSSTDCGAASSSPAKYYQIRYDGANTLSFASTSLINNVKADCIVSIVFPSALPANWTTLDLKKAGKKVYLIDPVTQAIVLTGDLNDGCGLTECLDGVLNVAATQFKQDHWNYDYVDAGNPTVNFASGSPLSSLNLTTANPYRIGTEGIWRMEKSWTYQTERKQSPITTSTNTKIQDDGTFDKFVLFDWRNNFNPSLTSYVPNTSWTNVNEVTRYNPYGFEIENKNAINIYTAALYGYNNSLQTAIANNAKYFETAFESFEDQGNTYAKNNGHLQLLPTSGNLVSVSHTGKKSLEIGVGQNYTINIPTTFDPNYHYFQPPWNNRYIISAWFKVSPGAKPVITLNGVTYPSVVQDNLIIEGWQKVEAGFFSNSTAIAQNIIFSVSGASGSSYIDDIRIQPYRSTMKTFVYDPKTLWLVAELDNQNYATFYNYDEEGTLTQVKKETVKGIQTLKTTRSNIQR